MKEVDYMKNKKILKLSLFIAISIFIIFFLSFSYTKYNVKNAIKIVKLKYEEVEVYKKITLKNLIKEINGELISNHYIDTTKLGKQKIKFEYITTENIKVPYEVEINIVDKTPPIISQLDNVTITVGEDDNISESLFCGDNYDNNPKCFIEGNYDVNNVGVYPLTFVGIDSSNNKSTHKFTLSVKEKSKNKNESNNIKPILYEDIIKKYKTNKTKIGIDISHWQGNIDFLQLKKEGVEFAYIRVGRGDGIGNDYVIDTKFKQNIEGFNKVGIPIGVYFYSYANSKKDAKKEAEWVLKQIKNYQVDLEIVFDWENWNLYQDFNLSFYNLTEVSNTFVKVIEKAGYKGMLYSSKNYLETVWYPVKYPIWLAHYTDKTNDQGKYKLWQLCNNGKIKGIEENLVDINIMYE